MYLKVLKEDETSACSVLLATDLETWESHGGGQGREAHIYTPAVGQV